MRFVWVLFLFGIILRCSGAPYGIKDDMKSIFREELSRVENHLIHKLLTYLQYFKSFVDSKIQIKKYGRITHLFSTCTACKFGVGFSRRFLVHSDTVFKALFDEGCKMFAKQTPRVCEGLADIFSPQILFILRNSQLTSDEMCATLMGHSCIKKDQFLSSASFWKVDIPPPPPLYGDSFTPQEISGRDKKPLNVLHLSDFHIDREYTTGLPNDCGEPLCCRPGATITATSKAAGYWGSWGNCDCPLRTAVTILEQIKGGNGINEPLPLDYAMFTGDIAPHEIWNATRAKFIREFDPITNELKKALANVPLLPVVGNHEAIPVDMFPSLDAQKYFNSSWLYHELWAQWEEWIPADQEETFKLGGYYTVPINSHYTAIIMNSNFCQKLSFWNAYEPKDPGNQLKWLIEQLLKAEEGGKYVHILGHVNPTNVECTDVWMYNYLKILQRFNSTIKAQFFGHTHADEINLFYERKDGPVISMLFNGGSVTTYGDKNPMYRIYQIAPQGDVLDHVTYFGNITEANAHPENGLKMRLEYWAKEAYGMKTQTVNEWEKVVNTMKIDPETGKVSKSLENYSNFYHRFSDADTYAKNCKASCKLGIVEGIKVFNPLEDIMPEYC